MVGSARLRWLMLAGALVLEAALLAAWQRNGYFEFSDGVYALTARELLHGARLYRDVAAAQPPPVYLVGAGLLAIHDGLGPLRAGLACLDIAGALLVAACVMRLTGRIWVAAVAALLTPLVPITLHEHALLTPETLAAPLLLGGALAAASQRRAAHAGVLLALATGVKLAFVVPALAVVLAAPRRSRALAGFACAGLACALAALAGFGGGVWREAVHAQLQVGHAGLHYFIGLVTQGAWNELPLLAAAIAGLVLARGPTRDEALKRTVLAAALGGLLLTVSLIKRGSYVNVLMVAEPPLVVLASVAAVRAWESRHAAARVVVALASALLAAQSLSLLSTPGSATIARRPGAASGLSRIAAPPTISREVASARRCPPSLAYGGSPYVAFLAGRRLPGGQPDLFMIRYAPIDARYARLAAADQPRCPA